MRLLVSSALGPAHPPALCPLPDSGFKVFNPRENPETWKKKSLVICEVVLFATASLHFVLRRRLKRKTSTLTSFSRQKWPGYPPKFYVDGEIRFVSLFPALSRLLGGAANNLLVVNEMRTRKTKLFHIFDLQDPKDVVLIKRDKIVDNFHQGFEKQWLFAKVNYCHLRKWGCYALSQILNHLLKYMN